MPVAITVEGANTLTRSLIVFGQGLNRAHPHMLDIVSGACRTNHGGNTRSAAQLRSVWKPRFRFGCPLLSKSEGERRSRSDGAHRSR